MPPGTSLSFSPPLSGLGPLTRSLTSRIFLRWKPAESTTPTSSAPSVTMLRTRRSPPGRCTTRACPWLTAQELSTRHPPCTLPSEPLVETRVLCLGRRCRGKPPSTPPGVWLSPSRTTTVRTSATVRVSPPARRSPTTGPSASEELFSSN